MGNSSDYGYDGWIPRWYVQPEKIKVINAREFFQVLFRRQMGKNNYYIDYKPKPKPSNDGFLLNGQKHFLGCPEYFQISRSILSSANFICLVILGQLESFRNYEGFSIIFPNILAAIQSFTKVRIFLCIAFLVPKNFGFPFSTKKKA